MAGRWDITKRQEGYSGWKGLPCAGGRGGYVAHPPTSAIPNEPTLWNARIWPPRQFRWGEHAGGTARAPCSLRCMTQWRRRRCRLQWRWGWWRWRSHWRPWLLPLNHMYIFCRVRLLSLNLRLKNLRLKNLPTLDQNLRLKNLLRQQSPIHLRRPAK